MDAAHVISRPVCRYSDAKFNGLSSKLFVGRETSRVSFRARSCGGVLNHGFVDSGHLRYYVAATRRGEKEKVLDMKTEKQRLKLIKRLSKDLSVLSSGIGCDEKIEIGDAKGKLISEATEVLLAELQQLKSEQKEQKRKRKEVKVQQKAAMMGAKVAKCDSESSSSSSSSESSDSDCEEVVPMSCLKTNALTKQAIKGATALAEPLSPVQEVPRAEVEPDSLVMEERMRSVLEKTDSGVRSLGQGFNANVVAVEANGKKVEVCMGGKCKKLGAVALLEEFQREVGCEAAVVGCKCMGKCKTAPNVKVLNCSGEDQELSAQGSARPVTNPLCIAVGLEDVSVIVANHLGKDKSGGYLMVPS